MIIAIDFDGVVVERVSGGDLTLMPNAKAGLASLKTAGHILVLWSTRNNRGLRFDPELEPTVRTGVTSAELVASAHEYHIARYQQMLDFIDDYLPGMFDAVDDGRTGKPVADLFIDDHAVPFGPHGVSWRDIANVYGEEIKDQA